MLDDGARRASPTVIAERGVCAAGHPLEAAAGAELFEVGGNAVDAAVAAAFVGCVVEQHDCSLGGFVHVSMHRTAARDPWLSVDGYVRAPGAAHAEMFELEASQRADERLYYGMPNTRGERARYGALAVALPGAVAGLCAAHARGGRLPRQRVLEPAIAIAERGVPFGWREKLAIAEVLPQLPRAAEAARVLLPGGALPHIAVQNDDADRLDTSALAATLRRIAERGVDGFYEGPVARAIAAAVRAGGGIIDAADLASYKARVLAEHPASYADWRYVTCDDHVGYQALQMLDGLDVDAMAPDGFAYRHAMAESLGAAFTDALAHYGDPEHVRSPAQALRSRAYADARRAQLHGQRALPRPMVAGDPWPFEPAAALDEPAAHTAPPAAPGPAARGGTSQVVAADREGNIASIISAVGWNYGSLVYVPEVGVFLNNGMLYFDPRPGRPASIAPHKMPMFGAPALSAQRGDGVERFAAAGSGGYRISTAVLAAFVNSVSHDMSLDDALDHPRVHCQGDETFVDARVDARVREALAAAGHRVVVLRQDASTLHFGRVCAVRAGDGDEPLRAAAAPSWATAVRGV